MYFIESIKKVSWVEITAFFCSLLFILIAISLENYQIAYVPVIGIGALVFSQNLKLFYYLFAIVLPFSIEMELPGGFGTDLPTEPIMWAISGLGLVYLIARAKAVDLRMWKHPISILLFLHVAWIGAVSLLSSELLFSMKYLMAKIWYVFPFYFLFGLLHRSQGFTRNFFKILIASTSIAIVIIMVRHGMEGFSFRSINDCVHPIFRNHVNYAVMLVALLPYLFWLKKGSGRKSIYNILILLFGSAIYLSYTRAAIGALLIGFMVFIIINFKWIKAVIIIAFLSLSIGIPYILNNNRFMDFAPNYERTIAHYDFDNLIEATYKMEDISTMERLYRWLAGLEMIKEKPIFGYGPSTFYSNYQNFTVTAFETYVSNNPEKSGIHNYYLMLFVEQGLIGFLIWILLIVVVFVVGQKTFHLVKGDQEKALIMAILCSIGMVVAILLINDLMEVDKIGPLVFIGMAIIATRASYQSLCRD